MAALFKNWPRKPANVIFHTGEDNEKGRGSYGVVYSGIFDGRPVAVKRIHSILLEAPDNVPLLRDFEKECSILKSLQHPNIVEMLGTFRDDGNGERPLLVMEAYEENLKVYLTRNKGKLSVSRQLEIAKEVTEGLCFLHRNNIVHRDLKLENILVGKDGHVRIGDFGQSKLLGDICEDMKTTKPGTFLYMPPEALKKGSTYNAKIDVFSLGVVFNCIATQCEPTTGIMGIGYEVELKRRAEDLQAMAKHHPLELLIRVCLQDDPVIRPDVFMVHNNLNILVCGNTEPELQRKIETLKDEKEHLNAELHSSKGTLRDARKENNFLKRDLKLATDNLRGVQEQNDVLKEDFKLVTDNLRVVEGQNAVLKAELESTERDLRSKSEQRDILQNEFSQVMNILGLLQEKYKRTHEGIVNGSSPESEENYTTEAPDDELQQAVVELEKDSTSSQMDSIHNSTTDTNGSRRKMGFDKQNVNRRKCTEVDCECQGYEHTRDGSHCSTCRHVAVKHVVIGATGSHKAATNLPAHHSEDHDVKKCYQCSSQYSSSKHGACITCYPRSQCSNPKCTELAYHDKDLGSFNYCSQECRDECELKSAHEELKRALKEFEVVPGKDTSNRAPGRRNSDKSVCSITTSSATQVAATITGTRRSTPYSTSSTWSNQSSPHTTNNMSVGSASQPTTSTGTIMTQSDTSSTISANSPVVTSHRNSSQTDTSQSQPLSQNKSGCITGFSVPASIFHSLNTTFYDSMKGMDIHGNTGILVSAITLGGEICDLRPLDLVTHIGGRAVKDMLGFDGGVWQSEIPTSGEVWLTVQRVHHIPPVEELRMSFFGGEHVPRTCTSELAAVSCTSKDLKECATFLGVSVQGGAGYGSKKICRVPNGSVGFNIGLTVLDTIVSVAMVTTERTLIGPEPNWSFEYIKSTARENPGICALLLLLQKQ